MKIQHTQYDRQITALIRTNKKLRQRCRETCEYYFAAQEELKQYRERDGLEVIKEDIFFDDTEDGREKTRKTKPSRMSSVQLDDVSVGTTEKSQHHQQILFYIPLPRLRIIRRFLTREASWKVMMEARHEDNFPIYESYR